MAQERDNREKEGGESVEDFDLGAAAGEKRRKQAAKAQRAKAAATAKAKTKVKAAQAAKAKAAKQQQQQQQQQGQQGAQRHAAPPCYGGVLADEMGMGKTIQTVALLVAARGRHLRWRACRSAVARGRAGRGDGVRDDVRSQ